MKNLLQRLKKNIKFCLIDRYVVANFCTFVNQIMTQTQRQIENNKPHCLTAVRTVCTHLN